jgi:hypothetical protein
VLGCSTVDPDFCEMPGCGSARIGACRTADCS